MKDFKCPNQPDGKEARAVLSHLLPVCQEVSTTCFYCKDSPRYTGLSRHGLDCKPNRHLIPVCSHLNLGYFHDMFYETSNFYIKLVLLQWSNNLELSPKSHLHIVSSFPNWSVSHSVLYVYSSFPVGENSSEHSGTGCPAW